MKIKSLKNITLKVPQEQGIWAFNLNIYSNMHVWQQQYTAFYNYTSSFSGLTFSDCNIVKCLLLSENLVKMSASQKEVWKYLLKA